MINWVYIFFFTFLTPLITSKLRGVSELGVQSACLSLRHCLRPGRDLWPPLMCVPAHFTSRALSFPCLGSLRTDIPSLNPSLENGILWAQPQMLMSRGGVSFFKTAPGSPVLSDSHLWTCWPFCFGGRCPTLCFFWYLCSLVNVIDLEMVVNACVSKEDLDTCQKGTRSIRPCLLSIYCVLSIVSSEIQNEILKNLTGSLGEKR